MNAHITELMFFPVKSLAGFSLQEAQLTPTGIAYDRHWMIANESGRFITQRQSNFASLALIKTSLSSEHLILSKEGLGDFLIPLKYQPRAL